MTDASFAATAYGCRWQSALPLSLFEIAAPDCTSPDISVIWRSGPAPVREFFHGKGAMAFAADGLRYSVDETAVLDSYRGSRIEVFCGENDVLPAAFYGTVTAAVMTWRGGLAMHGTAVEIDGRGVLLCGRSGTGKSTLAAALIAAGARLVSDDLSVIHLQQDRGGAVLFAGRRTLRLFPDVAVRLSQAMSIEVMPAAVEAKRLVVAPRAEAGSAVPLSAVIVLGEGAASGRAADLPSQLYRPRAFRNIPGDAERRAHLQRLARHIPVLRMKRIEARDALSWREAADSALTLLRAHVRPSTG